MRKSQIFKEDNVTDGEIRLSDLKKGDRGEILITRSNGELRRRLLDMGLVKGSQFTVVRKAPLGDPIEIKINGFLLSLRLEEAREVIVSLQN